jgi:trimeric autotransporter adhesin
MELGLKYQNVAASRNALGGKLGADSGRVIRNALDWRLTMKNTFRSWVVGGIALLSLAIPMQIQAATFVVWSTADSGRGSLRQAILNANASSDPTRIIASRFFDVITITLETELPPLTVPIILDGRVRNPINNGPYRPGIELDGRKLGAGSTGLRIQSSDCHIEGMIIHDFSVGIAAENNTSYINIDGNYIGTDATGTVARGNLTGIDLRGSYIMVGYGSRNVISGNNVGIRSVSDLHYIKNNYVGTDVTGTRSLGNTIGIGFVDPAHSGGVHSNVISGNNIGVVLWGQGHFSLGKNYIGTDKSGTAPLVGPARGNRIGILIISPNNFIGDFGGSGTDGNVIAFNDVGIEVDGGNGNLIRGNSILSQLTGLGIDLMPSGVTINDFGDADGGPNDLQNYPDLYNAWNDGVGSHVAGTLSSKANAEYTIEFFSNLQCHPSGYGEGKTFLHSVNVSTDRWGVARFNIMLPSIVPRGQYITATEPI